jgi:hypothetical protein
MTIKTGVMEIHVSHVNGGTRLPQLAGKITTAAPDELGAPIDEAEEIREVLSHYLAAAEAQAPKPT